MLCTALCCDCTPSCTERGTYHHRPGEETRKLHSLGWPIAEYRHMFFRLVLLPFTLEGYLVKGNRRIHDKWNWLLHPKLTKDPLKMMPVHYPEVYQWHLGSPNMLPSSAICRQGAQCMRVRLPYNLHKWIMFVIVRHHSICTQNLQGLLGRK